MATTSLKVLVVDDLRTIRFASEYEVVYARTVVAAAVAMTKSHFDLVLLDHDLGPDEVKRLVTFIEKRHFDGTPLSVGEFWIVSDNPVAHQQFPALRRLGYRVASGSGPGIIDREETTYWATIAREVDEANSPFGAGL
ncbi:MAG TPA: cyclic-phosphate processing receiver domain-containing protein [Verrucomicrobiae bacterium]|nr:cyclic-phosphate processing receiver domain-containing protein [Verrucomicrobiae bacterium]